MKLLSMDVYRDGGSISVTFATSDINGSVTLLFPVKHGSDDESNRQYNEPVLEIFENTIYHCTMTNQDIPDFKKSEIKSTWIESLDILNELHPYIAGFKTDYPLVYQAMLNYAQDAAKKTQS
jgi:hypothetical protein